jgi:hypothetical protein
MLRSLLAVCFLVTVIAPVWADDPVPEIGDIMKKLNNKKAGIHGKLKDLVKEKDPKWEDIAKKSKEYKTLIDALGKNKPPQGDQASWDKLTKAYAESGAKFVTAAEKKDKEAAFKALTTIDQSCAACHKEHRPVS